MSKTRTGGGLSAFSPKMVHVSGLKRETPSLSSSSSSRRFQPKTLPAVQEAPVFLLTSDLSHLLSGDPAVFLQSSFFCCHEGYFRHSFFLPRVAVFPGDIKLYSRCSPFRYVALLLSFSLLSLAIRFLTTSAACNSRDTSPVGCQGSSRRYLPPLLPGMFSCMVLSSSLEPISPVLILHFSLSLAIHQHSDACFPAHRREASSFPAYPSRFSGKPCYSSLSPDV